MFRAIPEKNIYWGLEDTLLICMGGGFKVHEDEIVWLGMQSKCSFMGNGLKIKSIPTPSYCFFLNSPWSYSAIIFVA